MTFFIPQHTICPLCRKPIERRVDAVRPEWAHPDDIGALAHVSRAFVHRECWEAWEHRDAFVQSARKVASNAVDDRPLAATDGVFLYERMGTLNIVDVDAPMSLFIEPDERGSVLPWLDHQLGDAARAGGELIMGENSLHAAWENDRLDIVLAHNEEPAQKFSLPAHRRCAWQDVVRAASRRDDRE